MVRQDQWASTFGRAFDRLIDAHTDRGPVTRGHVVHCFYDFIGDGPRDGVQMPEFRQVICTRSAVGEERVVIRLLEFTTVTLCPGTFDSLLGVFVAAFRVTCTQNAPCNPVSFSCLVPTPILSRFMLPKFRTSERAQKWTHVHPADILSTLPPQYPCLRNQRQEQIPINPAYLKEYLRFVEPIPSL